MDAAGSGSSLSRALEDSGATAPGWPLQRRGLSDAQKTAGQTSTDVQAPFKKLSRPPLPSAAAETPTVRAAHTDQPDLPCRTASPPPLPSTDTDTDTDVAKPRRPAVEPTIGHSTTPRESGDLWDPRKRYWSSMNSFPDYGHASAATALKSPPQTPSRSPGGAMAELVKKAGALFIGNNLNGPATRQMLPPSTAKRTSDPPSSTPNKRLRTNGDAPQDIVASDGLAEQHDTPGSANGAAQRRKDKRDSQSQRSSGDRQGSEVNEFRMASKHTGIGRGRDRNRHKKESGHTMSGRTGGDQKPVFLKSRALLSRQPEVFNDQISDNDDEDADSVTPPQQRRQVRMNGRGTNPYTQTTFKVPDVSSDDELSQPQPRTKLRDAMVAGGTTRRVDQAFSGTKRSAGSPDELQILQASKRRADSSNRGDTSRTKFEPGLPSGSVVDSFSVKRAVCDRSFIYPAVDGMHDTAKGATNKPCSLVMSTKGDPKHFRTIDSQQAEELHELEWITPNLSRVNRINWNVNCSIVRLFKSTDSGPEYATGANLFIEFGSSDEANTYTRLCQRANRDIKCQEVKENGQNLVSLMARKTEEIKNYNKKRTAALPPDMQLVARQEMKDVRMRRTSIRSVTPRDEHAQVKTLRAQMRVHDDGLGSSPATTRPSSQGRTPRTPAEFRQLQNVVGSDDDEESHRVKRDSENLPQSPSRTNRREATYHRALRSANPKTLTPSPVLERWTVQNPNWVENRSYKIPLVYERTTVNEFDIERLDEGQFLNDEVISFYAKYLHKQLEVRDEQMAKKVYVFSSFFWEKLRTKGYDGVKSWTSKIDLLSFDYIVVPINQNAHWFLAIVCNPRALLPQDNVDPEEDETLATEHDGNVDSCTAIDLEAKSATVASDTNPIPVEDQLDGSGVIDLEDAKHVPSSKKSKAKRGPGPRKYDPRAPRVITLDSLDGSHTSVATALKVYLKNEIQEKKGLEIETPSSFGMTAKDIPFQTNFTDCGVYLLGYLEEFMKNPPGFTKMILQHEGRDWDINAPALRNKIRDLIFDLQADYQNEQLHLRREKKRLADERKAKSRTPTAELQSSPRVASERPVPRTPVIASSGTDPHQRTPTRSRSGHVPCVNGDLESVQLVSHPSLSPPPLRRQQRSPGLSTMKSSQSQDGEPDTFNASTIVNPSDSVEMKDERTSEHTSDESEATPRVMKSVEAVDQSQHEVLLSSPEPSKSRDTTRLSESSQTPPAGDFDSRKFMPPIGSSSSPEVVSKANGVRSPTRLSKTPTKTFKYDGTRSRFFTPSTNSSSLKSSATKFTGVDSDAEVEETRKSNGSIKRKQGLVEGRSRHTIDLTDD